MSWVINSVIEDNRSRLRIYSTTADMIWNFDLPFEFQPPYLITNAESLLKISKIKTHAFCILLFIDMPIFTLYDQSHESKGCWTGRPTDGQRDKCIGRSIRSFDRFNVRAYWKIYVMFTYTGIDTYIHFLSYVYICISTHSYACI